MEAVTPQSTRMQLEVFVVGGCTIVSNDTFTPHNKSLQMRATITTTEGTSTKCHYNNNYSSANNIRTIDHR